VVGHIPRRISLICSIFSVVKIIGRKKHWQMKFHSPNPPMFFTAKVLCYTVCHYFLNLNFCVIFEESILWVFVFVGCDFCGQELFIEATCGNFCYNSSIGDNTIIRRWWLLSSWIANMWFCVARPWMIALSPFPSFIYNYTNLIVSFPGGFRWYINYKPDIDIGIPESHHHHNLVSYNVVL